MLFRMRGRKSARMMWVLAGSCGMVCAGIFVAAAVMPDQPASDAVGVIAGEDISVTGPMSVEVVGGQTKTILRSGSEVRVKSGRARISLAEGGEISICGPAHFSVLKSGGSLTVALQGGVIHARMEREPALTVYTAEIQAQPVAIGDDPRDFLVGFETAGTMCVRTYRGAMRLEQQLSGQSVMVPQGGDVMLANGQIETLQNGAGHCNCELQIAKVPQAPPASASVVITRESEKGEADASVGDASVLTGDQKPEGKTEPIYTVVMPPLRFDASAKVQPEPDPKLVVIVRRVRVRPTLIFQGRVEGEPVTTAVVAPPQPPVVNAPAKTQAAPAQGSVVDRVRSFFHRLWTRSG